MTLRQSFMTKQNKQPTAHLIIGFIGAGKTTFAKKLEQETKALRFTKDEWVISIFGNDPTIENFETYDKRITALVTEQALRCLEAGNDVIIDDGFWSKSQRDDIRTRIAKIGGTLQFYYLKRSLPEMKKRTLGRNGKQSNNSFDIDEKMFDGYIEKFEEPSPDEEYIIIDNQ